MTTTTYDIYGPYAMLFPVRCTTQPAAASVLDVDTADMLASIEDFGWCGGIMQPDGEHVVAIPSGHSLPDDAIEYLAIGE